MAAPALPPAHRASLLSLVFNLEAIGESEIGIGQRSAVVFARHQFAGEEVADAKIGDE